MKKLLLLIFIASCRPVAKDVDAPNLKPVAYMHYVNSHDSVWHCDSVKVFYNLTDSVK